MLTRGHIQMMLCAVLFEIANIWICYLQHICLLVYSAEALAVLLIYLWHSYWLYTLKELLQVPETLCLRVFSSQEHTWTVRRCAGILELMVSGVTLNQCQMRILETDPSFLVLELYNSEMAHNLSQMVGNVLMLSEKWSEIEMLRNRINIL